MLDVNIWLQKARQWQLDPPVPTHSPRMHHRPPTSLPTGSHHRRPHLLAPSPPRPRPRPQPLPILIAQPFTPFAPLHHHPLTSDVPVQPSPLDVVASMFDAANPTYCFLVVYIMPNEQVLKLYNDCRELFKVKSAGPLAQGVSNPSGCQPKPSCVGRGALAGGPRPGRGGSPR
jgi:hypothetical protein